MISSNSKTEQNGHLNRHGAMATQQQAGEHEPLYVLLQDSGIYYQSLTEAHDSVADLLGIPGRSRRSVLGCPDDLHRVRHRVETGMDTGNTCAVVTALGCSDDVRLLGSEDTSRFGAAGVKVRARAHSVGLHFTTSCWRCRTTLTSDTNRWYRVAQQFTAPNSVAQRTLMTLHGLLQGREGMSCV